MRRGISLSPETMNRAMHGNTHRHTGTHSGQSNGRTLCFPFLTSICMGWIDFRTESYISAVWLVGVVIMSIRQKKNPQTRLTSDFRCVHETEPRQANPSICKFNQILSIRCADHVWHSKTAAHWIVHFFSVELTNDWLHMPNFIDFAVRTSNTLVQPGH